MPAEMTHPSLQTHFVPPPELKPQWRMPRNDRCWCGSGKKWKQCHRDRESQPRVRLGERFSRLADEFKKGYCSHPQASFDNCSNKIISAHTVQRRGGIAAIAENGHVVSAKSAVQNLSKNRGAFVPCKVGVRSASTFMGFCDKHDNSLFQPVEKRSIALTPQSCFLLGFRGLSYELFNKRAELRSMNIMRELDCGLTFEQQCQVQQELNLREQGAMRGLADGERWKNQYDSIYLAERFEDYRFVGVTYSSILPVVGCGAFYPEFDFAGNALQRISRGTAPHEHVDLNLTVLNDRSVLVIGWTEGHEGPAALFGRSFANVPDEQKANMGIQLGVEHIENVLMKPSWWDGLSDTVRNALVSRMRSGTRVVGPDRDRDSLRPDGHPYTMNVHVVNSISS